MARPAKFDYKVLERLIKEGKKTGECAKILGVSPQSVSQARRKLGIVSTKVTVLEAAGEAVGEALDALGQIRKVNTSANEILDLMMGWIKGDKVSIQTLEHQMREVNVGAKEDPEYVTEYKITDPHVTALKAMGEIRHQLKLQLEIFQAVYDMKAAEEFQKEVIAIIGEVDPDARTRIISRLREKQAIRQSVTLS